MFNFATDFTKKIKQNLNKYVHYYHRCRSSIAYQER